MLALLAPEEEELVRKAAAVLDLELTVVRTRPEYERRALEHDMVLVGDHQPPAERLSLVRSARDADDEQVVAAIATDAGMKVDLLEAGADALVLLGDPAEKLVQRIDAARNGQALLDPDETAAVLRRLQRLSRLCVDQGVDIDRCQLLTDRERDIVALLARRATNGQIAESLSIAVGTVKNHVHNILAKLDVDSRGLAGIYWRVFNERTGLKR